MRHLILNLESPLMSFGGETIDNYGVIRPFPAASMLTGMLANALDWRRVDRRLHQELQDRLIFAAQIDREPHGGLPMRDFQTAQLNKDDKNWTTRGQPEGRAGGANTYNAPHLRYRDYYADMHVTVALRLDPEDDAPTLDKLADALREPGRPLFIGRKPCLPSAPLFGCFKQADSALDALLETPLSNDDDTRPVRMMWPATDGQADDARVKANQSYMLTDQRNWESGLHGGGRLVYEGTRPRNGFGVKEDQP